MQGYDDWEFGFGFGRRNPAHPRGYDREFGGPSRGGRGHPRQGGAWGGSSGRPGYDRGIYGDDYPAFGGVPGSRQRGMYFGGPIGGARGAYEDDYEQGGRGRWSGAQSPRGGRGSWGGRQPEPMPRYGRPRYQQEYQARAVEPFLPESAYLRHPELERQDRLGLDRWPGGSMYAPGFDLDLDDDEIEQAVRQNLHLDNWIDADRIEVEVSGGVVTLRGEVDDYMQARYAWDDTWETGGVRGVLNQLTVRVDKPEEV
jgi:hypothetical protein